MPASKNDQPGVLIVHNGDDKTRRESRSKDIRLSTKTFHVDNGVAKDIRLTRVYFRRCFGVEASTPEGPRQIGVLVRVLSSSPPATVLGALEAPPVWCGTIEVPAKSQNLGAFSRRHLLKAAIKNANVHVECSGQLGIFMDACGIFA